MKQKLLLFIGIILMFAVAMTGCGNKTATEETTTAEATTVEAPIETDYRLYEDVINSLEDGTYYAFADMSKDHDALLVATETFDDLDGSKNATEAIVYGLDKEGKVKEYGTIESGGTANPIAAKDGYVYYGGHHYITKATIKEAKSKLDVNRVDEVIGGTEEENQEFNALYDEYFDATVIVFMEAE